LIQELGLIDPNDETYIWEKNNGKGFHQGKVKLHEVSGQIRVNPDSIACDVNDGNMVWSSVMSFLN
jgi:hypothetical protein